jgi:hypothetical protein
MTLLAVEALPAFSGDGVDGVAMVSAFRTATLKKANSLRNIWLCMWDMRL